MKSKRLLLLLLLVLATTAAGCTGTATHPPSNAPAGQPPAATMKVGLTEWSIITSTGVLSPGRVAITVTNTGTTTHDLLVRGGGTRVHTRKLPPGAQQTLRVDAPALRTLHLSCTLPGHHQAGMHATVHVAQRSTAAN